MCFDNPLGFNFSNLTNMFKLTSIKQQMHAKLYSLSICSPIHWGKKCICDKPINSLITTISTNLNRFFFYCTFVKKIRNANKYHEQNNLIWTRSLCCCIGDYRNSHSFWCSVLHIFRNGYIFIEQTCKDTRSILSNHQSEKCLNRAQCCLNIKLYH